MTRRATQIAWRSRLLSDGGVGHQRVVRTDAFSTAHPANDPVSVEVRATPCEDDSEEDRIARLLAVLFLAKEPLTSRKLSQYSRLADGTAARTLVTRLNRQLDAEGRPYRIEPVAGGHQLVTRPKFSKWLRRLEYVPGEVRLSAPAMETLAVVAYRQPVLRADIEAIRGVSCGEILSQLLSRDLVRIGGRSNELGRPYLYNTTKRFLQLFGLRSLDDLPRSSIFRIEDQDVDQNNQIANNDATADQGHSEEN